MILFTLSYKAHQPLRSINTGTYLSYTLLSCLLILVAVVQGNLLYSLARELIRCAN